MDDEELLVVDSRNRPLGLRRRADVLAADLWRRASGGLLVDLRKHVILCHRRSGRKDERPGLWVATFGGKVRVGEETEDAARRELLEELGLLRLRSVELKEVFRASERRQFEYVYLVDVDSQAVHLNTDIIEVEEVKWLPFRDAIRNIRGVDWYEYGYEVHILTSLTDG